MKRLLRRHRSWWAARPPAIRLFAAIFLLAAVIAYIDGLREIPAYLRIFGEAIPEMQWNADMVIVALSARLTIAAIPVLLIWLYAANFARWFVTIFALAKLVNLPGAISLIQNGEQISAGWILSMGLTLIAVALLFTPGANRWFRDKRYETGEECAARFS